MFLDPWSLVVLGSWKLAETQAALDDTAGCEGLPISTYVNHTRHDETVKLNQSNTGFAGRDK